MPRQTDHSNDPHTDDPHALPAPELNPLLNPLLGQHMGRWAEVYFTSPPERREQAVWELVRELEAEQSSRVGQSSEAALAAAASANGQSNATRPVPARAAFDGSEIDASAIDTLAISPSAIDTLSMNDPRTRYAVSATSEGGLESMACSACGFENPAGQRFCGMCGTRLVETAVPAPVEPRTADFARYPMPAQTEQATESDPITQIYSSLEPIRSFERTEGRETIHNLGPGQSLGRNQRSASDTATPVLDEFPWRRDENSLFRIAEEVRPRGIRGALFADSMESSGGYRRYFFAAVVIFVFGYLGWRVMQHPSTPAAQPQTAATPSTTVAENPVQPPAPSPVATSQPVDAAASASANTGPATNGSGANGSGIDGSGTNTKRADLNRAPAQAPPIVQASAASAKNAGADPFISQPSGILTAESSVQDLATARSLLDGANGHQRNSREAAGWLWRAVSKQNAEATFLLSDLYLRGDGVSKNCDQARVLLDAAARKGLKDAADRLRNLPALGCQ